jgi:hypothetical protein
MLDDRAIELYTQFRNYARKLPRIDRPMLRPLADGQTMSGQMILFVEAASDFSRELFNSMNDIARSLLTLKAWTQSMRNAIYLSNMVCYLSTFDRIRRWLWVLRKPLEAGLCMRQLCAVHMRIESYTLIAPS